MALNQFDRVILMGTPHMQARCTAAVQARAKYLTDNNQATEAEAAWAKDAMNSPETFGVKVSKYLLNDPNFLSAGTAITDDQVQTAAETAINTYIIPTYETNP